MTTLLNERLCKQLIAAFFRRVRNGEKIAVILHSLLHEVFAQGVAVGKQQREK